ncbi:MAG: hypothetical protein QGH40_10445 [bacterium]|nr:hypothetical protein [bacterium]
MENHDEFIPNPSPFARCLIEIVNELDEKHAGSFKDGSIFSKFTRDVKIRLYSKQGYLSYYEYLKAFQVPSTAGLAPGKHLALLLGEFSRFYEKLMYNNIVLACLFLAGGHSSNPIWTMEDEKIKTLSELFHGTLTFDDFKKRFGHYAMNLYDPASKRFQEYAVGEIMSIAELATGINFSHKCCTLDEYLERKTRDLVPVLLAIREMGKYQALFIIRDMRYVLLELAERKQIDNIFQKTYEEITAM